jgi:hypothetical protein
MPSPLPRRSGWAYCFAHSPSRISLPRKSGRVGLRIVLFEVCSAFTRVTAYTLALTPIRDTLTEGFSHFVTSMTAPVASGWSDCRVGLAPTGKRRLCTAHTQPGHRARSEMCHNRTRAPLSEWRAFYSTISLAPKRDWHQLRSSITLYAVGLWLSFPRVGGEHGFC